MPAAAAEAGADLWLFLQMYEENRAPLQVLLNGETLGAIDPDAGLAAFPVWQPLAVPAGRLRPGVNRIELRCEAPAMNAWMLGIEDGHRDSKSFLSTDRAESWRNDGMGIRNVMLGEYMIRLRSHSGQLTEPAPPAVTYEDPNHRRVKESLRLVPRSIQEIRDPWKQLLALRTWVAQSWGHRSAGDVYTPWDPWTILDWAKQNRGHGRGDTISMCVHFATLFVSLASALGHRARCVIICERFNEATGHFIAEAWDRRLGQWVLHDPNYDVHYVDGKPLSAVDIADRRHRGESLVKFVISGKGRPTGPPRVTDCFDEYFGTGRSYRCVGIWASNQYVSDPVVAPPNHGSIGYCETDIVWYCPAGMDLAPMFPYRVSRREYFEREP